MEHSLSSSKQIMEEFKRPLEEIQFRFNGFITTVTTICRRQKQFPWNL